MSEPAAGELRCIVDDIVFFAEGPRWHQGRLWFSDMHGHRVRAVTPGGQGEVIVETPGRPSGLGFLPDGRLLVVSMDEREILAWDGARLTTYAALAGHVPYALNEILVDGHGRVYAGHYGFDFQGGEAPRAGGSLVLVEPGGAIRTVAEELTFPNGMAITGDGRTLLVAESFVHRLTAFDVAPDGSLSDRRVFAEFDMTPDGICVDAEGAAWVADIYAGRFIRVVEGGAITDEISMPGRLAVACMLGGDDRQTLFCLSAAGARADIGTGRTRGYVDAVRVAVPGAGWP